MTNRSRGHNLERQCTNKWKEHGFNDAMTSRAGDRSADSMGVDIINVEPFRPQVKMKKSGYPPLNKIEEVKLEGVPILHARTDRKKGLTAMYDDHFFKLVSFAKEQAEMHGISLSEVLQCE